MGTLASLLGTIGDVTASAGKAKEEIAQDELRKKQIYDQLESSALQREALRKQISLMGKKVEPDVVAQMKAAEQAMGRPLTPEEKERFLKIAPPKPPQPKVAYQLVPDPNAKKTGYSKIAYDPFTGEEYSRQLDATPMRGLIESETTTTDPLTGLTTVSHRKPILGGKSTPAGKSAPTPSGQPRSAMDILTGAGTPPSQPVLAGAKAKIKHIAPPAKAPATKSLTARPSPTQAKTLPLDASGHIPASPLVNPYVREAANSLLDGMDVKQIQPAKIQQPAKNLARRYGWEQGKFTPKEQTMLREATNFIQRSMNDNSMRALDEGTASRLQLQQLAMNPDKEGYIGRGLSVVAAQHMSDSQKEFIQAYNQMVGTISGLSQLVRSNRATEATIERLKAELPNPSTTRDSKDAHERLQRLMDEINVAMQKGTFTGPESNINPATKARQFIQNQMGRTE